MIDSFIFGLLLITGLTHSLPYPQEIHVQNIDQIINESSTITTQIPEITPIEINTDNEQQHHHHHHDHQTNIELPQDNQNSGRSLDSTTNYNPTSNSGLLTSIFLNPAVRPTDQPTIRLTADDAITTVVDSESSTDSEMLKDHNERMINDTIPKMIAENVNRMEENNMKQKDMIKDLNEDQNDQPAMDDEIMSEHKNDNHNEQNQNTEINRKYTEINRDNQYLPINRDNNQYLPINNRDHQYSTVENDHENSNMHHNHNKSEKEESDDEDMKQTHDDIKYSTDNRHDQYDHHDHHDHHDHTEMIVESTSMSTNLHENKSDADNKIDSNKSHMQEAKASSGNKLETISKFGTFTLLLYITYICL